MPGSLLQMQVNKINGVPLVGNLRVIANIRPVLGLIIFLLYTQSQFVLSSTF